MLISTELNPPPTNIIAWFLKLKMLKSNTTSVSLGYNIIWNLSMCGSYIFYSNCAQYLLIL